MLAQLVVIAGPDTGGSFPLEDGQTLIIGRGQDTHTQLKDPRCSRKHCLLQVDGGTFLALDEESAGGTFVNGQRITRRELKPGDVLKVGAGRKGAEGDIHPIAVMKPFQVLMNRSGGIGISGRRAAASAAGIGRSSERTAMIRNVWPVYRVPRRGQQARRKFSGCLDSSLILVSTVA